MLNEEGVPYRSNGTLAAERAKEVVFTGFPPVLPA